MYCTTGTIYTNVYVVNKIYMNVSIGDRLLEERRRFNWSQGEMAKAGGVALVTYSNYEKGTRYPDAECLANLYLAGVDVLYVVTGARNSATLSNAETVLLEQFNRAEPRMQQAVVGMLQIYNTAPGC